jgi:hypothetical protein
MPISQVLKGGEVTMSDAQLLKYYLKVTVQPEAGGCVSAQALENIAGQHTAQYWVGVMQPRAKSSCL